MQDDRKKLVFVVEGAWNADGKSLSIWDCFTLRHLGKYISPSNHFMASVIIKWISSLALSR